MEIIHNTDIKNHKTYVWRKLNIVIQVKSCWLWIQILRLHANMMIWYSAKSLYSPQRLKRQLSERNAHLIILSLLGTWCIIHIVVVISFQRSPNTSCNENDHIQFLPQITLKRSSSVCIHSLTSHELYVTS